MQLMAACMHPGMAIHINLSAGAQNITGANVLIMLVCRRLLTTRLPGKAAV